VGQQSTKYRFVFFVLVLLSTTIVPSLSAADEATLSIQMLQGEQQSHFNKPVLVAGVWHYINITVDQIINELSVRFYKGIALSPGNKTKQIIMNGNMTQIVQRSGRTSVDMELNIFNRIYVKIRTRCIVFASA